MQYFLQNRELFLLLQSQTGNGEMAEWSNAAVLKTVDLNGFGGSNPSLSAKPMQTHRLFCFERDSNMQLSAKHWAFFVYSSAELARAM